MHRVEGIIIYVPDDCLVSPMRGWQEWRTRSEAPDCTWSAVYYVLSGEQKFKCILWHSLTRITTGCKWVGGGDGNEDLRRDNGCAIRVRRSPTQSQWLLWLWGVKCGSAEGWHKRKHLEGTRMVNCLHITCPFYEPWLNLPHKFMKRRLRACAW